MLMTMDMVVKTLFLGPELMSMDSKVEGKQKQLPQH